MFGPSASFAHGVNVDADEVSAMLALFRPPHGPRIYAGCGPLAALRSDAEEPILPGRVSPRTQGAAWQISILPKSG